MIRKAFGLSAIFGVVLATSCSDSRVGDYSSPPPTPVFESLDASTEPAPEAGLTSYCPSDKCPAGLTTCPTSQFPCDVNLKADRDNCGECGFACPKSNTTQTYECVEGRCVLACGERYIQDCDGIADNGCETKLRTDDNCTACGDKCLDPAKPCVLRMETMQFGCGCLANQAYCKPDCVDLESSDHNCGACGNECDPDGDGEPLPEVHHAYYGCLDSKCGRIKCERGHGDCDGNRLNGCETETTTSKDCGGCGNSCAPGQVCSVNEVTNRLECMCPEGETYCLTGFNIAGLRTGTCNDLATSKRNCGGCGVSCDSQVEGNIESECRFGMCVPVCPDGFADCNRNPEDGCEVRTDRDPQNCGGCGRTCDAVAGQACVRGQCVVEPCDEVDGGGVVAR